MPREIVTLQVGQCGNQLGLECWKRLLAEHGIQPRVISKGKTTGGVAFQEKTKGGDIKGGDLQGMMAVGEVDDRKDIMFYEADSGDYIARTVLLDLEPRVVHAAQVSTCGPAFNQESVWVSLEGGGAGNIWASGFAQAHRNADAILDILDRELELCDNLEAFQLLHSMAGGTGSGMGSFMLEALRDRFPKKLMLTYSVLPLLDKSLSDVVVQPYNAILTLARLIEHADGCILLDNTALNRLATERQRLERPSFAHTNYLVATVMATLTGSIRFPSYTSNSLTSVLANVVTSPLNHFLVSSIAPLESEDFGANVVRKTSVHDVLRRCFQPNNFMVTLPPRLGRYRSLMCFVRGDPAPLELTETLERIRKSNAFDYGPTAGGEKNGFEINSISLTRPSPYLKRSRVSGLILSHHSGLRDTLRRCTDQFDVLLRRQAFLDNYRREPMFASDLAEFERAREVVETNIDSLED
ncbi:tubulin gamma chain [Gregarina niphandrodes]|uniref:Tubulin gamma chain n=1 Tax=Gregarina niphandrodes TaxID=110365 RepID=A0A023B3H0_GRENI|nr:tubulin gamma chain [Gregarina niphandrodes]EZG55514.1 tubulin gamma chain [Gregarina niphandrodes]|eukprot:XP_011131500.1 tubulin gamma chain [Gregarina niphandrodes]